MSCCPFSPVILYLNIIFIHSSFRLTDGWKHRCIKHKIITHKRIFSFFFNFFGFCREKEQKRYRLKWTCLITVKLSQHLFISRQRMNKMNDRCLWFYCSILMVRAFIIREKDFPHILPKQLNHLILYPSWTKLKYFCE